MQEFLSNYWIGLLVLGPIAGVVWAWLLNRNDENGNPKHSNDSGQQAIVKGNGNKVLQNNNSNNRNEVHNHYNSRPDSGIDPMGQAIAIFGVTFLVGAFLSWGFAKYGPIVTETIFTSSVFVALFVTGVVAYGFMNKGFDDLDLPISLILVTTAGLNGVASWTLKKNFRPEVVDIANSQDNVINFFLGLSSFGKALLLTQALFGIVIALSTLVVI